MVKIGLYEAQTHFPELVDRVAAGESVSITRHGEEVVCLVPSGSRKQSNPKFKKSLTHWRKTRKGLSLNGAKIRDLVNEGKSVPITRHDEKKAALVPLVRSKEEIAAFKKARAQY
ncbi:MAG: type II toxin-antitoxin system prevent-host-death family antitoxin [Phycisphaerales bacterium]|nr:type II toxin-antitoxin system prevent-host-death family antitoxin [Phycisphaerales bacterium]